MTCTQPVGRVARRGRHHPSRRLIDDHSDALSISALYDRVELALARAFPRRRSMWVRGEIQSIVGPHGSLLHRPGRSRWPRDRQAPVLKVKCWRTTWEPMSARLSLDKVSTLEPGMVVVLRGTLDFYKPRAELGFVLTEIDVAALLGRLAARRAALLELLRAEGLLERNRRLAVPTVPLRVGLVASPGTEGHSDFVGQLLGLRIRVRRRPGRRLVQGLRRHRPDRRRRCVAWRVVVATWPSWFGAGGPRPTLRHSTPSRSPARWR